jgi:hypothetical protein
MTNTISHAAANCTVDQVALSEHVVERMSARGLSVQALDAALRYGRKHHVRGAIIRAIGRKEVVDFQQGGINLSAYEGVQVVCSPDGTVITMYRNQDFRGLRPKRRRCRTAVWS